MPKSTKAQRKAVKKGFSLKDSWGQWNWRPELVGHPKAPKGMYACCHNKLYSAQFFELDTEWGDVVHIILRRHDGRPDIPWTHKQRIKNEIFAKSATAIEVFPPEKDLVDDANCYHLWVLPAEIKLPFGL